MCSSLAAPGLIAHLLIIPSGSCVVTTMSTPKKSWRDYIALVCLNLAWAIPAFFLWIKLPNDAPLAIKLALGTLFLANPILLGWLSRLIIGESAKR